jgi:hypothetical protein
LKAAARTKAVDAAGKNLAATLRRLCSKIELRPTAATLDYLIIRGK